MPSDWSFPVNNPSQSARVAEASSSAASELPAVSAAEVRQNRLAFLDRLEQSQGTSTGKASEDSRVNGPGQVEDVESRLSGSGDEETESQRASSEKTEKGEKKGILFYIPCTEVCPLKGIL